MVHEASHKYAGTEDHAYNPSPEYWSLSPELAIENADSYAWFCRLEHVDLRKEQEAETKTGADQ